jgi:hypothetical protein
MGDGERKSAEPMAARACPDPDLVDSAHQRLGTAGPISVARGRGGDIDGCRNSQILGKELAPIRYLPESGTPLGQDGSTVRSHGPNGEKPS